MAGHLDINHLTMYDTQMALFQQALELKDKPLNITAANELLTSLRKSHVLSGSMPNPEKLTHCSGADPVMMLPLYIYSNIYNLRNGKELSSPVHRDGYSVTVSGVASYKAVRC